jgi:hypothetical protein
MPKFEMEMEKGQRDNLAQALEEGKKVQELLLKGDWFVQDFNSITLQDKLDLWEAIIEDYDVAVEDGEVSEDGTVNIDVDYGDDKDDE